MTAVDTNVLVYACDAASPRHARARDRLTHMAQGDERWAIPVFCLGEFLRVTTHRLILATPRNPAQACRSLAALLESPSLTLLLAGDRYWRLLAEAVVEAGASGNLVFDAQIVALCRESGVNALLTEDRDFDRWKGFRTIRL